ncbi:hypothetical protein BIY27_20170 [Gibbsiella quercinecans]|uniref:DUF6024 family protein n=1 Tax=Gibbsiella quercinecans TaxID=929813 RepID=UPI000EF1F744|nr:DUF6024 family protein [Gibbsiella quercinecans]RLM06127.1 hypothetical protein BIY27_20170 [Gibbsiella quercinecans]
MDASSLSPLLQQAHGDRFYKRAGQYRDELRTALTRLYKLDEYDVFFVPSVRIGMVILSHLFRKQNVTLCLAHHEHYQPINLLFPDATLNAAWPGEMHIITHVNPYTGAVNAIHPGPGNAVVDASHSFATGLHQNLVAQSNVFIAPLHKHASLTVGLALVAMRTAQFSTLLRSELRLFEEATASLCPLQEALKNVHSNQWQPYNVAQVGAIRLTTPGGAECASVSDPGLPFSCLALPALDAAQRQRAKALGGSWFPETQTLRLSGWARGQAGEHHDATDEIISTLTTLWSTP